MSDKLSRLREQMAAHKLDYYFVPSTDAHGSEYVPPAWQRRTWISGFDGSAGDALIGKEQAYLWVDPRYFLQAEQQLDAATFTSMRQQQGVAPIGEWLQENTANLRCGVDPRLINVGLARRWEQALKQVGGELVAVDDNLVDQVWDDQPILETHGVRLQALQYTGEQSCDKLTTLRERLRDEGVDAHVVTTLDAVAWLFNIRGSDINYNPLVISYAIITEETAELFMDVDKLDSLAKEYFVSQGVQVKPYAEFAASLQALAGRVLLDSGTASWWVSQQLKRAEPVLGESPITLTKARKNSVEQNGMFEAHRLDALALAKFFCWLDHNWKGQTEVSVANELSKIRLENSQCLDLSFTTIAGFSDHGAIIHYGATAETDRPIDDQAMFLIDSGGQYYEGTTDVTRTVHLGSPTEAEKEHYTMVLKGHLALRHVVFPKGTTGMHIDVLARQHLWRQGLDYGHGTGHGVGSNLCCHEGPQRISQGIVPVALDPGMVVSNEPGVYFPGKYGIRIENLCLIEERFTEQNSATGHGPFYAFEDLTMVPYARNLINTDLLTAEEIAWLNDYHAQVYDLLADDLPKDVRIWLKKMTKKLRY
jgi:Xaa-Pro aminopeptidase